MAPGKAANHAESMVSPSIAHPDMTSIGAPNPKGARTAPKAKPGIITKPVRGSVTILATKP